MALPPLMFPLALMLPGVAILPFTLAPLNMFPLRLSCTAFTVPPLVILPPMPATLLVVRSNPGLIFTLLITLPDTEILPVLILPVTLRLGKVPIDVATTPVSCDPLPIK